MMLARALVTVFVCLMLGSVLGTGVGYVVGTAFPDAIRVQFRRTGDPAVNVVQIGAGLGLIQGTMLGAGVGVVLAGILAWHDVRTRARSNAV